MPLCSNFLIENRPRQGSKWRQGVDDACGYFAAVTLRAGNTAASIVIAQEAAANEG
jgi:hypothetical protein